MNINRNPTMNTHWNACDCNHPLSRREMLRSSAAGFASLALAGLLAERPQAKRVIFLFMHGGPSQVDTFDYKPLLTRDHGKPLPFAKPRVVSSQTGNLLKSPWKFSQHGQSGAWVSELFPHVAGVRRRPVHHPLDARLQLAATAARCSNCTPAATRSSAPAWARGSPTAWAPRTRTCPASSPICPTLTHGGVNNWSSAFLPAAYQGTPLGNASIPSEQAKIPFIDNAADAARIQRLQLDLLARDESRTPGPQTGPDAALEGRIDSFELAFRMQAAAPELQDIRSETPATQKLYGLDDPKTRELRPAVPDGPPLRRARRALRAGHAQLQVGPARRT